MYCLPKITLHIDTNFRSTHVYCKTPIHVSPSNLTQNPTQPLVKTPLVAEHLIKEYGLSREKATSFSTVLPLTRSPAALSSVPNFFKQNGFSDTQIKDIISKNPRLLFAKIETTLEPKFRLLEQELGFSSLVELIMSNPSLLFCSKDNQLIPAISIVKSLLHSNEKVVKVLKRSRWLLSSGQNKVGPNANFLHEYGLSDHLIAQLLYEAPVVFTFKLALLKDVVKRVENFGVARDSKYFTCAVRTIGSMSESTVDGKFQMYMSYGLSESDILSAFCKYPRFLSLSEEKVRKMMSFLMGDLGYDLNEIVSMPIVMGYNVDKRLKPRASVMKILNLKGLVDKKYHIYTIASMTEEKFLKEFVVKFLDRAPEIEGAYYTSDVHPKKKE